MLSSQISIDQAHMANMKAAASFVIHSAETYLSLPPQKSRFGFGAAQNCQKQAEFLLCIAHQFLLDSDNRDKLAHITYYGFVKDTVEVLQAIPPNDKLRHYLEQYAIPKLHSNLNQLMQYRASQTSQEFLGIFIVLLKEKFHIPDKEDASKTNTHPNQFTK